MCDKKNRFALKMKTNSLAPPKCEPDTPPEQMGATAPPAPPPVAPLARPLQLGSSLGQFN